VESSFTSGDAKGWPGRPQRDIYKLDLKEHPVNVSSNAINAVSFATRSVVAHLHDCNERVVKSDG
jgi:hypothetical protein